MPETKNDFTPLWGARAIGAEIGKTARQAFHLLETGVIPGRKVGGQWVSERGKLRAWILGDDVDAA